MALATMYYIRNLDLSIGVMDGKILTIEKGKRPFVISTVVDGLEASFSGIFVADEHLYLDGFALTDFMAWLWLEKPNMSPKAFDHRLKNFFPNSININDVLLAIGHVVLSMEHRVNGERQHFAAKVRDAHPAEFAELQSHFTQRIRSHNLRINECSTGR